MKQKCSSLFCLWTQNVQTDNKFTKKIRGAKSNSIYYCRLYVFVFAQLNMWNFSGKSKNIFLTHRQRLTGQRFILRRWRRRWSSDRSFCGPVDTNWLQGLRRRRRRRAELVELEKETKTHNVSNEIITYRIIMHTVTVRYNCWKRYKLYVYSVTTGIDHPAPCGNRCTYYYTGRFNRMSHGKSMYISYLINVHVVLIEHSVRCGRPIGWLDELRSAAIYGGRQR